MYSNSTNQQYVYKIFFIYFSYFHFIFITYNNTTITILSKSWFHSKHKDFRRFKLFSPCGFQDTINFIPYLFYYPFFLNLLFHFFFSLLAIWMVQHSILRLWKTHCQSLLTVSKQNHEFIQSYNFKCIIHILRSPQILSFLWNLFMLIVNYTLLHKITAAGPQIPMLIYIFTLKIFVYLHVCKCLRGIL